MNISKAIAGWHAGLVNGRDFRVEDHLDGRGQAIVWLSDNLPVPDSSELDAGWANWLARDTSAGTDPMTLLASQVDRILRAIDMLPDKAFQAFLEARAGANHAEPEGTPNE